jgi:hypothetical protein
VSLLDCKKASGGEAASFFGVPNDDFTLLSGKPKGEHYIADSGKGLYRNFCPECGARVFSDRLESFPGLVFVTLGSLDRPELISPKLEMFTKRRMKWVKPVRPSTVRQYAPLSTGDQRSIFIKCL